MCEALMRRGVATCAVQVMDISSAGIHATPDTVVHPWAITAAREFGISLGEHRARLLTPEMLQRADVVFVMDYENKVQLLARYPQVKSKVRMLGFYAGGNARTFEIRDPYYQNEEGTRRCYKLLDTCVRNLIADLLATSRASATSRSLGCTVLQNPK